MLGRNLEEQHCIAISDRNINTLSWILARLVSWPNNSMSLSATGPSTRPTAQFRLFQGNNRNLYLVDQQVSCRGERSEEEE